MAWLTNPLFNPLTHTFLEERPEAYKGFLQNILNSGSTGSIQNALQHANDNKQYHTWYSNAIHCLYRLVGDFITSTEEWRKGGTFYGAKTSISEELGIDIFKLLIQLGTNINDSDYYNETVLDIITNEENGKNYLTTRTNNTKFIEVVKEVALNNK